MSPGSPPRLDCQPHRAKSAGHGQDAHQRVDGVEPGGGHAKPEEVQIHMRVGPHQGDVGILVVGDGLKDGDRRHDAEGGDDAAVTPGEGRRLGRRTIDFRPARQIAEARQVGSQPDQHQRAGQPKPDVPAVKLGQQSANQGSAHRPHVDADGEDGEPACARLRIVFGIKLADLCGDIALQKPAADDQEQERRQERGVEGHGDVARAHRNGAEDHRRTPSQPPVGHQPAEDGREIDKGGVEAINL